MEKELVVKLDEELIRHAEHLAKEKGKTVDQLVASYFSSLGDSHHSYEPMSSYARRNWLESTRLSKYKVIFKYHHNNYADMFSTWYSNLSKVVPAFETVQLKSYKGRKTKGEETPSYNMSLVWAGDYPSGTFGSIIADFVDYEHYWSHLTYEVANLPFESQTGWEDFESIKPVQRHSQDDNDLSPITRSFVGILESDDIDSSKSDRQTYHEYLEEKYR